MTEHSFSRICQDAFTVEPWAHPGCAKLPGLNPLGDLPWLVRDEAFNAQMAYRDHLLATRLDDVVMGSPRGVSELFELALDHITKDTGYIVTASDVTRPDGVTIPLTPTLQTLGRLVQEDFCLLSLQNDEFVLDGAVLCFPAGWKLADKINKPMFGIHKPVENYTERLNTIIERIMTMVGRAGPVWRANCLDYHNADLFQPFKRIMQNKGEERFIRVERQTLRHLPNSDVVVFGIKTQIVPLAQFDDVTQKVIQRFVS